jgi:AcrR family transcriptional regulator
MQGENKTRPEAARKRRGGRPSAAQVGDVDRRILDAAQRLFLVQGYDATNCEQVVAEAGAGKASLYARYANKQELFAAVVERSVASLLTENLEVVPTDRGVAERLRIAGKLILEHALQEQVVALMRVVISAGYHLPQLAGSANAIGRARGLEIAAAAIAGEQAALPDAMARALPAAAKFIDLAFVPLQMRAVLGDDLNSLRAAAPKAVEEAVQLLLAGGLLDGWQ